MNLKAQEKLIDAAGLGTRLQLTDTTPCMGCTDRTKPCAIDRDKHSATWWVHRTQTLLVELALTRTQKP